MLASRFGLPLFLATLLLFTLQVWARQPLPEPALTIYRNDVERIRQIRAAVAAAQAAQAAQAHQLAVARLRDSMLEVERRFQLPTGTLGPANLYDPSQLSTFTIQLQHPTMRMLPVSDRAEDGSRLYMSTGVGMTAETRERYRSLLLFRVYRRDGRVIPIGHTRVREGIAPGYDRNFMDHVWGEASENWRSLQSEFGHLRVVDP